jgi:putative endonuclease
MSAARQQLGELGEAIAARWLRRRGWRVLARRYRVGHRDLDLIVSDGTTVAFVEVKARRGTDFGHPVEAVTFRKRRELARSALVWLDRHGRSGEAYRFDVFGILIEGKRVRVRHISDAFRVPFFG